MHRNKRLKLRYKKGKKFVGVVVSITVNAYNFKSLKYALLGDLKEHELPLPPNSMPLTKLEN